MVARHVVTLRCRACDTVLVEEDRRHNRRCPECGASSFERERRQEDDAILPEHVANGSTEAS